MAEESVRAGVATTARQWRCDDRVAATIWWYMRSSDFFAARLGDDPAALRIALTTIIDQLDKFAPAPSMWAIATDSLANRALELRDADFATTLAAAIGMPAPRFVEIEGRQFVRRASCCLIFEAGAGKCVSCPKRTPEERQGLLTELVRRDR